MSFIYLFTKHLKAAAHNFLIRTNCWVLSHAYQLGSVATGGKLRKLSAAAKITQKSRPWSHHKHWKASRPAHLYRIASFCIVLWCIALCYADLFVYKCAISARCFRFMLPDASFYPMPNFLRSQPTKNSSALRNSEKLRRLPLSAIPTNFTDWLEMLSDYDLM